ncbi:Sperm transmembrane protein 9 [Folsomia candida]|uniref:Sperm transmembrane protein 9 n=1 Tax=Folsomia candida TaxID=158441 RepID=A0A226DUN9_FOLCA|nr:Sperm transmembrane protein 9 [Folsomia candida]
MSVYEKLSLESVFMPLSIITCPYAQNLEPRLQPVSEQFKSDRVHVLVADPAQCYSNNECAENMECPSGEKAYCVVKYGSQINVCKCLATAPLSTMKVFESYCSLQRSEVSAQNKWTLECTDSGGMPIATFVDGKEACVCDPGAIGNRLEVVGVSQTSGY